MLQGLIGSVSTGKAGCGRLGALEERWTWYAEFSRGSAGGVKGVSAPKAKGDRQNHPLQGRIPGDEQSRNCSRPIKSQAKFGSDGGLRCPTAFAGLTQISLVADDVAG